MNARIFITGSEGLIGTALRAALLRAGCDVTALDLRALPGRGRGNVCDAHDVTAAIGDCDGVVHLAAVSRVIWGERDPAACWRTNVDGTRVVLRAALAAPTPPWVLLASSREVYGQPPALPVAEDAPLRPLNAYGRSKHGAERLVDQACDAGLHAAVVRLSNVYGGTNDHPDRVVPAFVRAALAGEVLRVEGANHVFDFTHLDDTVAGLVELTRLLGTERRRLPPIHLVTGVPTTLAELAATAVQLAGTRAGIELATPRTFDVSRFVGDPRRAHELLGWKPAVSVPVGLARLIEQLRANRVPPPHPVSHACVAPHIDHASEITGP